MVRQGSGLIVNISYWAAAEYFDMRNAESPEFTGRAIAALANDPHLMAKTGQVFVAADLALEYGFTDTDGRQVRPLTLATA